MIFICAYLSIALMLGHFIGGTMMYIKPMFESNTDKVVKYVMYAVFHYMSVAIVLSSICLMGFAYKLFAISPDVIKFIGIFYTLCALTQIVIAIRTNGLKGLVKMFQWTLFLPVGILAIFSVMA